MLTELSPSESTLISGAGSARIRGSSAAIFFRMAERRVDIVAVTDAVVLVDAANVLVGHRQIEDGLAPDLRVGQEGRRSIGQVRLADEESKLHR
jgi:predicted ATP-dependent Lon-type protease